MRDVESETSGEYAEMCLALTLELPKSVQEVSRAAREFLWGIAHAVAGRGARYFCEGQAIRRDTISLCCDPKTRFGEAFLG